MFFIGVMGIDRKEKEVMTFDEMPRKESNENISGKLIKTYSYFHFFFIPVFRWNEKYYVRSDDTRFIYSLDSEKGKLIERGEKKLSYFDLKPIEQSNEHAGFKIKKVCCNCNSELKEGYEYCPYCGNKIDDNRK